MGGRASVELQNKNLFDQIAALPASNSFNRNQRTLFERLLLSFSNGTAELRLNRENSFKLFNAIGRYRNPSDSDHTAQSEIWMQNFDKDKDDSLDWPEFCEAVKILLQSESISILHKRTSNAIQDKPGEFPSLQDMSSVTQNA